MNQQEITKKLSSLNELCGGAVECADQVLPIKYVLGRTKLDGWDAYQVIKLGKKFKDYKKKGIIKAASLALGSRVAGKFAKWMTGEAVAEMVTGFVEDSPACDYFKDYNGWNGAGERPSADAIRLGFEWLSIPTTEIPTNFGIFKGQVSASTTGGGDVYFMGDYDYKGGKHMSCKTKKCGTCTSEFPIESFNGGYDCGESNTVDTCNNGRCEEGKAFYTHVEGLKPFGKSKRAHWCHALDALEYKATKSSGFAQDHKGEIRTYSTEYEDAIFDANSVGECAARCKWLNMRVQDGSLERKAKKGNLANPAPICRFFAYSHEKKQCMLFDRTGEGNGKTQTYTKLSPNSTIANKYMAENCTYGIKQKQADGWFYPSPGECNGPPEEEEECTGWFCWR